MSDREQKEKELAELRARTQQLESELRDTGDQWRASGYYTAYYATAGFMLGIFGAATSLLFNVVGSLLFRADKGPLWLIQVYLTFPLGEEALSPEFNSNLTLAIGVCLYLATGMLLGVPVHLFLTRFAGQASLWGRLAWASVIGLAIWVVNFYGILSWLQPLLFGDSWIIDEVPPYVGALTHLVFAWTMAVVYPLGLYEPYKLQTEQK
jgi:hypothetical protein